MSPFSGSKVMPAGWLNPVYEPIMVWIGATLPVAPAAYTVTELSPKFATYTLPLSTATPKGSSNPVLEPAMVCIGVALPVAPAA